MLDRRSRFAAALRIAADVVLQGQRAGPQVPQGCDLRLDLLDSLLERLPSNPHAPKILAYLRRNFHRTRLRKYFRSNVVDIE